MVAEINKIMRQNNGPQPARGTMAGRSTLAAKGTKAVVLSFEAKKFSAKNNSIKEINFKVKGGAKKLLDAMLKAGITEIDLDLSIKGNRVNTKGGAFSAKQSIEAGVQ